MKKFKKMIITAILCAGVYPGGVRAEEIKNENHDLKILRDLNTQINGSLSILQGLYKDLNRLGKVNQQGITEITMRNEEITPLGSSAKYIYVLKAKIDWKGDTIANITFDSSRGGSNSGYVMRSTLWMVRDASHPEGEKIVDLRLNVRETIVSGKKEYTEYRFTDDETMKAGTETLNVSGVQAEFKIIPIFDYDRKVKMTREYLTLIRDLELRSVVFTGADGNSHGNLDGVLKFE